MKGKGRRKGERRKWKRSIREIKLGKRKEMEQVREEGEKKEGRKGDASREQTRKGERIRE